MLDSAKRRAVKRYGLGPCLNLKAQVTESPNLPALWLHERAESKLPLLSARSVVTIVPTIGRPSLVGAVESALAQTVPDHQVLVVTDGPHELPSLPANVTVLKTGRQSRVVGVVRNIGLRVSQSPYVAFLDDDNTWWPNHLEVCLDTMNRESADIVYSSAERLHPEGYVYDVVGRAWDATALRSANFVDSSTIVVRRGPGVRFSRARRRPDSSVAQFSEDWEFVYRLSRRHKIAWTGQSTVSYAMSLDLVDLIETLKRRAAASIG